MLHLNQLTEKLERMDKRIEEMSNLETYRESVDRLTCFMGVKRLSALAVMVEVGDFKRFATAQHFASYLGLVPGEDSSGGGQNRLGITKAGNTHVRKILIEAAQSYGRGKIGYKSAVLKARQQGNPSQIIAYADRANERLRRKYYSMLFRGKKANVAKTAIARELACFFWGMLNNKVI